MPESVVGDLPVRRQTFETAVGLGLTLWVGITGSRESHAGLVPYLCQLIVNTSVNGGDSGSNAIPDSA
jgi:hypothetical protein